MSKFAVLDTVKDTIDKIVTDFTMIRLDLVQKAKLVDVEEL